MTTRKLLSALEAALPHIPAGDTRYLVEDVIADTRHSLALPPLPDTDPPTCGPRCGSCPRCREEDAYMEEMNAVAEARLAEFAALADTCDRCSTPVTPFGLDANGTMHPVFPRCETVITQHFGAEHLCGACATAVRADGQEVNSHVS